MIVRPDLLLANVEHWRGQRLEIHQYLVTWPRLQPPTLYSGAVRLRCAMASVFSSAACVPAPRTLARSSSACSAPLLKVTPTSPARRSHLFTEPSR